MNIHIVQNRILRKINGDMNHGYLKMLHEHFDFQNIAKTISMLTCGAATRNNNPTSHNFSSSSPFRNPLTFFVCYSLQILPDDPGNDTYRYSPVFVYFCHGKAHIVLFPRCTIVIAGMGHCINAI